MRYLLHVAMLLAFAVKLSAADNKNTNPLAKYGKEWNNPKYLVCNTAKSVTYMTEKEKEVIYILNMARMDPRLFCKTVVPNAHVLCGADTTRKFYKSLVKQMMTMQPVKLAQPDQLCYKSAYCHAESSGKTGYTGHDRQTEECKKVKKFNGECCHYGSANPAAIVLSLLIDEDVESLGHREICFTEYPKVAASIQPHKGYSWVTVIDFLF